MARFSSNRKTTPKVCNGKVQKKNRHQPTRQNSLLVGLEKSSCRHVLTKEDIWKFLRLIPDWKRVSKDLDLIFLAAETDDDEGYDGWYWSYRHCPQIAINGWEDHLRKYAGQEYFDEHRKLFERLGLKLEKDEQGETFIQFDEETARAFQLLHILLHELGHHHYRITKGEDVDVAEETYAEAYAYKLEKQIWPRYREAFHFHPKPITAA